MKDRKRGLSDSQTTHVSVYTCLRRVVVLVFLLRAPV